MHAGDSNMPRLLWQSLLTGILATHPAAKLRDHLVHRAREALPLAPSDHYSTAPS